MSEQIPVNQKSQKKNQSRHLPTDVPVERSSTRLILITACAAIVVVALVVAIVTNSNQTTTPTVPTVDSANVQSIIAKVSSVPADLQESTGTGAAKSLPVPVSGKAISVGGKPEVLYVGAEYCPFCAAERWPLMIALSRFGTFSDVGLTHSSSTDIYPNTPTPAFHGSSYSSSYIAFTPVEIASNQPDGSGGYTPLDTLTAEQRSIVAELSPRGGIPFVDFGGRYLISGATYDPGVLTGQDAAAIADSLQSPTSEIAKAILGTANTITATLCQLTANQPATACDGAAIKAISEQLNR